MGTITEDYCSFELSKLLKEKGFNEICNAYYVTGGINNKGEITTNFHNFGETFIINFNDYTNELYPYLEYYSAPTLQMVMKWLRKNHQIFIRPNTSFLYPIKWYSEIFCYGDNLKTQQDIKTEYYDSPEESYETAIKYCLENLI